MKKTRKTTKKNGTPTLTTGPVAPGAATACAVQPEARPAASELRTILPPAPLVPLTTIEAKIDVGFGNSLFVRGQGAGLSWDRGVPLDCLDRQTWRWSGLSGERLTFKLLLNDAVWAKGEDLVAHPGSSVEVSPAF